jgi:diacylglycerol kinase (ATP)
MRAAIIFGLGSSEKDLKPFQRGTGIDWQIGLPASSDAADAILIFGGDGTIHRHVAELVRLRLPVLIVPCGSGNDFARALGIYNLRTAFSAWQQFISAGNNTKVLDLGVITSAKQPASRHYFCTVGGVGLDADVARRANQLPRWLRGHGGYVAALPGALFGFAPLPMKISDQESSAGRILRNQPTILTAFANGPTYGGGMKIAPNARMDDGKLDVCLIHDIGKVKLLALFPTVYFGKHLAVAGVDYLTTRGLRIETETPLDVYADGEFVCKTPINVSVATAALSVITPSLKEGF